MIEVNTTTLYIMTISYFIIFWVWIIFMNKYFKWKTKYQMMIIDLEMLLVFSQLWKELWTIAWMDEMFNKARRKAERSYTKPKTKESTKKDS